MKFKYYSKQKAVFIAPNISNQEPLFIDFKYHFDDNKNNLDVYTPIVNQTLINALKIQSGNNYHNLLQSIQHNTILKEYKEQESSSDKIPQQTMILEDHLFINFDKLIICIESTLPKSLKELTPDLIELVNRLNPIRDKEKIETTGKIYFSELMTSLNEKIQSFNSVSIILLETLKYLSQLESETKQLKEPLLKKFNGTQPINIKTTLETLDSKTLKKAIQNLKSAIESSNEKKNTLPPSQTTALEHLENDNLNNKSHPNKEETSEKQKIPPLPTETKKMPAQTLKKKKRENKSQKVSPFTRLLNHTVKTLFPSSRISTSARKEATDDLRKTVHNL